MRIVSLLGYSPDSYSLYLYLSQGFTGGSDGKASAYNAGAWVRKISWRRKWQSIPVFLTGKSHGWRSLVYKLQIIYLIIDLLFSRSIMSDSVTPWTVACQASLSFTASQSLLKLMSIEFQPSCPLMYPSSPAFNLSQHQGLF